jgi:hypothetical protein
MSITEIGRYTLECTGFSASPTGTVYE